MDLIAAVVADALEELGATRHGSVALRVAVNCMAGVSMVGLSMVKVMVKA